MVTTLRLATVVLALAAVPAFAQVPSTPQASVIVAQGASLVKVAPDQAWVTVAVQTRDRQAAEARRLAAIAMTSVQAALKGTGIPADAIRTTGFSLNPDYDYVDGRQRMRGFLVNNQVQVRIDDIGKVADVLDAAGGLTLPASSTTSIANLRFDLKDRSGQEQAALRSAVEDAMGNARAMAAGAGVNVGRVVRIDQSGFNQPYAPEPMVMMARGADAAVSTPISPSEIEIRASVMVTVEIVK